jgi:hypothetical protein
MGEPLFDERVGARIIGGSVYCINEGYSFAYDVLRYNRTMQTLSGAFPCFEF